MPRWEHKHGEIMLDGYVIARGISPREVTACGLGQISEDEAVENNNAALDALVAAANRGVRVG
ncbi:hypothetical protein [Azospirillum sp. TSO5]|uniref:hypothetical protein n=1 Tax=Azospirillum sp. TSO5 TaxID=716760 RepID=UPI000D614579|nr:hypothetical protein [Azospirillum sp. TSO5]PWC98063.1 hypothetical protein TSO5_03425 [Azospirillum sp. TSO5]